MSLLTVPGAQAASYDSTSTTEKRRVDRVKTPKLSWSSCYEIAQCTRVYLPRDYDQPTGAKVRVFVLKVKARNQSKKIGTLFVNPGGPSGSGAAMALAAPDYLSTTIRDRFDIVGIDPRGVGLSTQVRCFSTVSAQQKTFAPLKPESFPYGTKEVNAAVAAAKAFGKACSSSSATARPVASAMSTAQLARDHDVIRRAVGDRRLNLLGFSYGSYLGQTYANMFPDRVRSIVIDGVLDPVAWAGWSKTKNQIVTDRLRSADGATKALNEILVRCGKAVAVPCGFASYGDPVKNLDVIAKRLKTEELLLEDGSTFGYPEMVSNLLVAMYEPNGWEYVDGLLTVLYELTEPAGAMTATEQATALKKFTAIRKQLSASPAGELAAQYASYDNSFEAYSGVLCGETLNPYRASYWPGQAAAADNRAKYFGRLWGWASVQCAGETWRAKDEDAYRGPFTRRTVQPILVVGNYWDPATNYAGAVRADKLLPNSILLRSDSWGHTAYNSSSCVTSAVNSFLLTPNKRPAAGKVCKGDEQPFTAVSSAKAFGLPNSPAGQQRPPVVPLVPAIPQG